MLGAILTDTLLFKSPTTTSEDRKVAAELASVAEVDVQALGTELIRRASDVSHRGARELVTGDFKEFRLDDLHFGVAVIETGDDEAVLARRDELHRAMRELRGAEYTSMLLVVTDVVNERTTVLVEGHSSAVAQALGGELLDDAIALPGVYSRKKQIVPALPRIREALRRSRGD